MKLRWPNRYERARLFLLVIAGLCAFTEQPNNVTRDTSVICGVVCFAAYLIAGLLKPLHDDTGEGA